MFEYEKIANAYNLDIKAKKYVDTFSSDEIEYLKDCQWVCTEKLDGMNTRILWDGYNLQFSGRTDKAVLAPKVQSFLESTFTEESATIFERFFESNSAVLYGETFGPGINKGGLYGSEIQFRSFDLLTAVGIARDDFLKEVSKALNVETAPYCMTGTLSEAKDYLKEFEVTKIPGGSKIPEGLVCKPLYRLFDARGNRMLCKIKKQYL